jgi:hypothetical protein
VVKKSRCSRQGDTITDALPTLQRRRKQIDSLNYLQDQEKRRYKRRENVAQKLGSALHETGKPTQKKTKQTMRQTADSPERGKATNKKKSREKNALRQKIQSKKSENKNTRNFALLPALVCRIEKHHSKRKRATKLATFVRKSFVGDFGVSFRRFSL